MHNALLIDAPERTVVRGPFRPFPRSVAGGEFALFPKPPWFVTARSAALTGRRFTRPAQRAVLGTDTDRVRRRLPGLRTRTFRTETTAPGL